MLDYDPRSFDPLEHDQAEKYLHDKYLKMTRTKTQKMRAKQERAAVARAVGKMHAARPKKGKGKKWHFALGTQWGGLSMGSGDKAQEIKGPRSAPRRREVGDLISQAPGEVTQDRSSKGRRQIIMEDEFVATVNGSTTFSCNNWKIQPGLDIYPWLAQVARLYERYKVRKWKFYFKPTVSQYNSLGSQGRIVLSCDYDAATEMVQNLQQAEGMSPHSDGLPYQRVELGLDPVRMTEGPNGKFVRDQLPPAGSDIKTYDAGRFFICTEGMSGAGQIGELRVAYEIELINPRLPNLVIPPSNTTASKCSGTLNATTALWQELSFTDFNLDTSVGNGLGITISAGNDLVMPAGQFFVMYNCDASNTSNVLSTLACRIKKNGVVIPGTTLALAGAASHQEIPVTSVSIVVCNAGDILSFESYSVFAAGTTTVLGYVNIALA